MTWSPPALPSWKTCTGQNCTTIGLHYKLWKPEEIHHLAAAYASCLLWVPRSLSQASLALHFLNWFFFFLECVLLILHLKVNIFPEWYYKCLIDMTKPSLVSNFYFPVCVTKHAGRRSNTQVERFAADVMIDIVEAKTQHLFPRC